MTVKLFLDFTGSCSNPSKKEKKAYNPAPYFKSTP